MDECVYIQTTYAHSKNSILVVGLVEGAEEELSMINFCQKLKLHAQAVTFRTIKLFKTCSLE